MKLVAFWGIFHLKILTIIYAFISVESILSFIIPNCECNSIIYIVQLGFKCTLYTSMGCTRIIFLASTKREEVNVIVKSSKWEEKIIKSI